MAAGDSFASGGGDSGFSVSVGWAGGEGCGSRLHQGGAADGGGGGMARQQAVVDCGELTSTLPFPSMPWILTADVEGKFTLLDQRGAKVKAFLGAGYEKISFHDHQTVRNDINADF